MAVERILEAAAAALGACVVVDDLSWPHGESVVVGLQTRDGAEYVGKCHSQPSKFAAELDAYKRWAPALGPCAPQLVAADDAAHVLVLSRLRAHHLTIDQAVADTDVSAQAGELLRRWHEAQPGVVISGYASRQRARVEQWISRASPGLLTDAEQAFARSQVLVFDRQADPIGVPCHRDWQPRNWLIDDAGILSVIDFEHARVGPWHDDLHRLWWNEWRNRQAVPAAFFEGYGRAMNDDERAALIAASSIGHLCTVVWSDERGDDVFAEFGRRSLHAAMSANGY